MSDLRPTSIKITIEGVEYGLYFSMKAVDAIQAHFDRPVTDLIELLSDPRQMYGNATVILTILINANIDRVDDGKEIPYLDADYVSTHLTTGMFKNAVNLIYKAFASTAPESEGDADPRKGGQQKNSLLPACSTSGRPFWGFLKKKSGT